ncbi:hypothetical protein MD484_g412, partial [Candolleomyces efflorescens]
MKPGEWQARRNMRYVRKVLPGSIDKPDGQDEDRDEDEMNEEDEKSRRDKHDAEKAQTGARDI